MTQNKVALIILDGWGNGKPYNGNAIYLSNTPNFDAIVKQYPGTSLKTSGEDVGLPEGQMGNSEVGHMNLGAGRVVYQQLVLINKAFKTGEVDTNKTLLNAVAYAKSNQKNIHLIGLVSDGGVHSSMDHVIGLSNFLHEQGIAQHYIHAFTDGRDTDPKSGVGHLNKLVNSIAAKGGKLASITGRYYAMDRDKRWERVKLAYDCLVNGMGEFSTDGIKTLAARYEAGETDEFIKPIVISENDKPLATIQNGDVVICFNFRTDRGREITMALSQADFHEFNMHKLNLYYVTLTDYDKTFDGVNVVFPDIDLAMTLGEVLEMPKQKNTRMLLFSLAVEEKIPLPEKHGI